MSRNLKNQIRIFVNKKNAILLPKFIKNASLNMKKLILSLTGAG